MHIDAVVLLASDVAAKAAALELRGEWAAAAGEYERAASLFGQGRCPAEAADMARRMATCLRVAAR